MPDETLPVTAAEALAVAEEIGDWLCATAYSYGDQCTWMGSRGIVDEETDQIQQSYQPIGPTLYDGNAGIALMLAHAFALSSHARFADVARSAMRHALARTSSIPSESRFGFFAGLTGIAWAAECVGRLTEDAACIDGARSLVEKLIGDVESPYLLDVISGAAGAAPTLLPLSERLGVGLSEAKAVVPQMAERIIREATKTAEGWSWGECASGEEFPRNLTGFAHGASGIAWSLLELNQAFGTSEYSDAAREAFRYEDHWFRPDRDNWPDFRESDGEFEPPPFMTAWCHGATGIGFARLKALATSSAEGDLSAARAAVRASIRALSDPELTSELSFTLCHGQLGIAEFLLDAGAALEDEAAIATAQLTARRGIIHHGGHPASWRPGGATPHGRSPSLMTGTAGIGYFYLRLADRRVPSILTCGLDS